MPLTFLSPSFLTRFPLLTLPRTSRRLNQITMGKIPKQLQSSNSISTNTSVYKRRVIKQRETNPVHGQASQAEEEFESTAKVQRLRTISKKSRAGNSTLDSEVSTVEQKKKRRKSVSADCQQTVEEESSVIVTKEVSTVEEMRNEPWTMLAHKKPQKDWVAYNPRSMRPPPLQDGTSVKLVSWNVNGLRAVQKLDTFSAFAQKEDFDILCLQETKLQEKNVEKIKESFLDGYENTYWTCSVSKLGYSGCAIISRIKPVSVKYGLGILDHDTEGRIVTVEFHSFYLICGYVPNSGDGLKRLDYRVTHWDPALADYMKELEKSKPVILTGDLNCAHQDIDIFSPATNRRSAGFTDEERESFEKNFLSRGFVDTFRRQHPGVVGYTYWGYRHGGRKLNKGWRLDYFLVSETIAGNIHDSYIIPDVTGSDHCPIGLILKV